MLAMSAGIASLGMTQVTHALESTQLSSKTRTSAAREVAAIIQRSAESNDALMRGDIDAYRALITLTDDFTLMSPFGGAPTHGSDMTEERWQAMGRFFRNGTLKQELVESYASPDMVVLATIERARVEVGGLPMQDWSLRVTSVYQKYGTQWRLAHRHADPLVTGVSLDQAARARSVSVWRSSLPSRSWPAGLSDFATAAEVIRHRDAAHDEGRHGKAPRQAQSHTGERNLAAEASLGRLHRFARDGERIGHVTPRFVCRRAG